MRSSRLADAPRFSGRGPTFADLMTPGFHSDDPTTWVSRKDLYQQTFNHEKGLNMATGTASTAQIDDVDLQMQALRDRLNESFARATKNNTEATFALMAPETLTVKKRDGAFAKKAHIGGEDFSVQSVYMGKRGTPIYIFKPRSVAEYETMEMGEKQAFKSMRDFEAYVTQIVGNDALRLKKEAAEQASLAAERDKLANRQEVYGELGFGSW